MARIALDAKGGDNAPDETVAGAVDAASRGVDVVLGTVRHDQTVDRRRRRARLAAPMGILLALLAATSYGAGDFFGGLASRHAPVVRVTLLAQAVGALLLVVLVPLVGGTPSGGDVALGAAAGIAGALALLVFYKAMGSGAMSVVAPVSSSP
mgnify:CR=1 FL=1